MSRLLSLFAGLAGLASDQDTFMEKLKFRIAMYSLREERDIKPASFGKLVSSLLYEKRFGPYFIEVHSFMRDVHMASAQCMYVF